MVGFSWLTKRLQSEISSPGRRAVGVFFNCRRPFRYVPLALRSSKKTSHTISDAFGSRAN